MSELCEITAEFQGEKWRPREQDNLFLVAQVKVKQEGKPDQFCSIVGECERGSLCYGVSYRFFGTWESNDKHGRQFRFKTFTQGEPHSRHGLVQYLAKYCPGIGPAIAGRMFDALGSSAVSKLRNDPEGAADAVNKFCNRSLLSVEVAQAAAIFLQKNAKLEDAKIELTNLLHGRGFPGHLIDTLAKLFGSFAATRIRRDPFILLARRFPGCGFMRVDRLYKDLGLSPTKLKRQLFALLHAMRDDGEGHTWHQASLLEGKLRQMIDGLTPNMKRTLELGVRSGRLATWRDDRGMLFVAERGMADSEKMIAQQIKLLQDWLVEVPAEEADATAEGEKLRFGIDLTEEEISRQAAQQKQRLIELGRARGVCQFCGRELDNPISVAHGYGPACAVNHGLPWDESILNRTLPITSAAQPAPPADLQPSPELPISSADLLSPSHEESHDAACLMA